MREPVVLLMVMLVLAVIFKQSVLLITFGVTEVWNDYCDLLGTRTFEGVDPE